MLPETPRTFLKGETLGHERDGTEELRMPEFGCVENRHEHSAEVILVKFHAIFLLEPPEGPRNHLDIAGGFACRWSTTVLKGAGVHP